MQWKENYIPTKLIHSYTSKKSFKKLQRNLTFWERVQTSNGPQEGLWSFRGYCEKFSFPIGTYK
jgi:hypothetical protein